MKIINEVAPSVPVNEMKDGDIAIIVKHPCGGDEGRILQRYKDILITLGLVSGDSYPDMLGITDGSVRVRILPKGTTLEI